MKKKWIASLLALTMALTLLPGMALAAEGEGTIEPITEVGVVSGDTIVVSDATLNWYPADNNIGRWQDGWWVGVRIIAPRSVTEETVTNVKYSNAGSETPNGDFNTYKDGKTEDGRYYMGAWLPVLPEYLESFINVNQILTWKYTFDWDGNGTVDQTFKIQVNPTNTTLMKGDEQVWPVAKIGDKQYASLENAIAAANGDTVTLLTDVTVDSTISIPGEKTVTLDLNGKTIQSGTLGSSYMIDNKGTLNLKKGTIKDTRTNETGTITTIRNLGTLDIDTMEITRGAGIAVKNDESGIGKGGVVTVKDSTITAKDGENEGQAIQNWGTVTITSGTFNGAVNAWASPDWNPGHTIIKGGTFNGAVQSLQYNKTADGNSTGWPTSAAKTEIHDGIFNGKIAVCYQSKGPQPTESVEKPDGATAGVITIDGGKFNTDVNTYVADGYEWYSYSGEVARTDHAHRTGVTCAICGYYRAPAPITTTETEKNEDGSTTTTTSNRLTGTTTETTTNTDGSTTVVETKKDGTVTTTEKAIDGTVTETVEKADGSSTAVETKTDGTVTTTEKTVDGTVTETVEKADGSSTAVETKADGTVTTTEKDTEGSTTATVQNTDGSTEVSVEKADGTTATATTDAAGKTEAQVTLSGAAIEAAAESKETVSLPIPEVAAAADKAEASVITVNTNTEAEVKVEIPVAAVTDSTVAVIVKADGTEEVIRSTELTEKGVAVALPDGATVKIVDNTKEFSDAGDHWAGKFINFASARELMNGTDTEKKTFEPDTATNRAMVAQVLHNMENNPEVAGKEFSDVAKDDWFGSAVAWASEEGIVGGRPDGTFGPDDNIYRQDLVVMLYQYAKKLGADVSASKDLADFTDGNLTDAYAQEAMKWAVGCGLMSGKGNGILDPKGFATRGELATFVMQFYKLVRSQV